MIHKALVTIWSLKGYLFHFPLLNWLLFLFFSPQTQCNLIKEYLLNTYLGTLGSPFPQEVYHCLCVFVSMILGLYGMEEGAGGWTQGTNRIKQFSQYLWYIERISSVNIKRRHKRMLFCHTVYLCYSLNYRIIYISSCSTWKPEELEKLWLKGMIIPLQFSVRMTIKLNSTNNSETRRGPLRCYAINRTQPKSSQTDKNQYHFFQSHFKRPPKK